MSPAVDAGTSGDIVLLGAVAEDCSIANMASAVDLGALGQQSSHVITFDYSCNSPFQYSLTSQNGALAHTTQPGGVAGFATTLPYGIDITLPTDGGASAGIADTCGSSEIAAGSATCSFSNSGVEIALDQTGSLALSWSAPALGAATPLLAGSYADSLTLTIATQP